MVKDDSLYIIAIVAVVAVVGLVVMATGSSSTVMVAEDLPSMVDSDSTAIAGQAIRNGAIVANSRTAVVSNSEHPDGAPYGTCEYDCYLSNSYNDDGLTEEQKTARRERYDDCVDHCREGMFDFVPTKDW